MWQPQRKIADACRSAGIKMLVDFHCSDFWTDPSKQMVPKAWKDYTVDEKAVAVEKFINESLNTIDASRMLLIWFRLETRQQAVL